MQNTWGNSPVLGEYDIRIDSSMKAFSTVWWDLRVAFYLDENWKQHWCYVDTKWDIFKINGKIVVSRSDGKIINGKAYEPACVQGGVTKYYDANFQPLTQGRPHPSLVYRINGDEYFIDKVLGSYDTIWGKIRKVQHNHPPHCFSCNHFLIDDQNQEVVNGQRKALASLWSQKEIDGKQYQRATFDDRVRRYYDADFQTLPISLWIENEDDDIVDIKELGGMIYVLRQQKMQRESWSLRERSDWWYIDNWTNSHGFSTKYSYSKPEIWGMIERGWETYIVIKSQKGEFGYDVIVCDMYLNRVWKYPIWKVLEWNIREAAIQRLGELIPEKQ